ncbi:Putative glycosyltransferase EpsH [Rosistilla oblonga]|uniref:glycosyltransferase n=1 Tax=Rosistilla oblonga TaxID=2527990 RepID=UPI00118D0CC6|nr:glycosyltransferase family 2 protein [Rosistilla oblonga]QDV12613.1 Putative glycosyltransferase EpsH [Rosistilla oblonga]
MSDSSRQPLITVVIPTRDRHAKMLGCLESLTRQTFINFEVIVVDDGSKDETREKLEQFATEHTTLDLRIIYHQNPHGANPSRNKAIRAGRGDLYAFIDDDCAAEPQWLERLQEPLENEVVAAVSGHVENVALSNIWELFFVGQHRVTSRPIDGIRVANRIVAGNLLVRAEFLSDALDEDRASVSTDVATSARGDEEGLRIKIQRAGKVIAHVPEAICYHDHPYGLHAFCRQAFRSGCSAARLALKFGLAPRWELIALLTALLLLFLAPWRFEAMVMSSIAFALFLLAVLYNELALKAKTVGQTIQTFPSLVLYYLLRTAGYVTTHLLAFRR